MGHSPFCTTASAEAVFFSSDGVRADLIERRPTRRHPAVQPTFPAVLDQKP